MAKFLQNFSFKKSPYARPTQRWICGNETNGHPCPKGPSATGKCAGTAQCAPNKNDDRWQCTRTYFSGGSCEKGPFSDGKCCHPLPPCQPKRSLSAKRSALIAWVSSATIAFILIGLYFSGGTWLANPGSLSNQHTQAEDCGSCHSAYEGAVSGWLHSAFEGSNARQNSQRCLECHDVGESPMLAHSIPTKSIEVLTASSQATQSAKPMNIQMGEMLYGHIKSDEIVCMACHREHKGAKFDLNKISNQTCISCHSTSFSDFSEGHPGFSDYPYQRRTRIAFDHVSHINKHFEDDDAREFAPKKCNSCHTPDENGQTMRTSGFDQNCSACHRGQIVGEGRASAKGIFVFGVPGLDREVLYEKGIALGEWPEFSEEPLSPFVELLLYSDENFVAAYRAVKDIDFMDIEEVDEQTLRHIAQIAWSFKILMFDLIQNGAQGLRERLSSSIDQALDEQTAADLIAMLPLDLILNTQTKWFPMLFDEVAQYQHGDEVRNPDIDSNIDEIAAVSSYDSPDMTDELLPYEVDDDELSDIDMDDSFFETDEENLLSDNLEDEQAVIDGLLDKKTAPDNLFALDEGDLISDEDDLFGTDDGLEQDEDDLFSGSIDEIDQADKPDTTDEQATGATREEWMRFGGWYQDDLALRYRPNGHEDKFVFRWLELGSQSKNDLAFEIFDRLSSGNAPGECMKCHSVDKTGLDSSSQDQAHEGSAQFKINWRAKEVKLLIHSFTKFSHTAHFSLLDQEGCGTCHQFDAESDFMSGFDDRDQTSFSSNFKPMDKSNCESCHQKDEAGDDCTACHSYHTGQFNPASPISTGMRPEPSD